MLYYLCVKYITYHEDDEDDFDNDDKKHDIANDKTWLAAPISSGTGSVILGVCNMRRRILMMIMMMGMLRILGI